MKKNSSGYKLIFGYLGLFLIAIGLILLMPIIVSALFGIAPKYRGALNDVINWWPAFAIPSIFSITLGSILFFTLIFKKERERLGKHQDSLLLTLIWLSACLIGMTPFLLRNINFAQGWKIENEFNFVSALFESISGFSASGLTVFDETKLGPAELTSGNLISTWSGYYIFVLYRSMLLFFGGVGLVLVVASAISDRYGLNLYQSEGHNDKLTANLSSSAKLIFGIYFGYIFLGTIALILAGMPVFDAVNASIAALSTGGFFSRSCNIGFFATGNNAELLYQGGLSLFPCNPMAIEIITMVLMILGATNFVTHFLFITFKFKKAFNDNELKFFGIVTLIFVPIIIVSMVLTTNEISWYGATRYGIYTFISSITTTGFSNTPLEISFSTEGTLPLFSTSGVFIVTALMFIGGGLGSTSGAVKQERIILALEGVYWNIRDRLAPKHLIQPRKTYRHGEMQTIEDKDIHEANSIIIMYLITLFIGTIAICWIYSPDLHLGMFQFMSALSGTGLSIDPTPFYALGQNAAQIGYMFILMFGMFIGRLEITPVIFGAYRMVKDIFRKETY